jgi:hypothetical protein
MLDFLNSIFIPVHLRDKHIEILSVNFTSKSMRMKLKIFTLILFIAISAVNISSFAQCTPETPEQCPDPENNGQICPDSLTAGYVGQAYSQVATIKPPLQYYLPPDSTLITLHHVRLMEVGNLPPGLSWQSNSPDSNFTAGDYYCVLLEGTPDSAGEYHLRIVVDVFVVILPGFPPVDVATVTDSTSLTINVIDNSGINGPYDKSLLTRNCFPNPFQRNTRIDFYSGISGSVTFEVYSILGRKVYHQQINAIKGENSLVFDGQGLPEGTYFYIFRSSGYKSTGIMVRKD